MFDDVGIGEIAGRLAGFVLTSNIKKNDPIAYAGTRHISTSYLTLYSPSALQIGCRIALGPAGCHGIAQDLAADGLDPVGCFQCPPRFHATRDSQQFRRFDLSDGPLPDPGKCVPLEPLDRGIRMDRRPARRELLVPLPRYDLEAVLHLALRSLLCFALLAGIDAVGDLLPRSFAALPRINKGNLRIGAEGDQFLLIVEAVLEAPPLPPLAATCR